MFMARQLNSTKITYANTLWIRYIFGVNSPQALWAKIKYNLHSCVLQKNSNETHHLKTTPL
jgi:hypothetical protein